MTDKKITAYCDKNFKQEFQDFCKKENYRESQAVIYALKRFMEDHDPDTFRGKINELLGAKGASFFTSIYNGGIR